MLLSSGELGMGRTIPSFRMVIDSEIGNIMKYYAKRLSDKKDRTRLLNVLNLSKRHSHACSEAVRIFPMESILMAILIERQKILEELMSRQESK